MACESRNNYQICREAAGFTQERAAEYLDVSVESLRAYEGGKRIPPDEVVVRMVDIYNARHLALQHLKDRSELSRSVIPTIELTSLQASILRLQKEINDVIKRREEILNITYDGKISTDEIPIWSELVEEMDDVVEAIMSVKFSKEVAM